MSWVGVITNAGQQLINQLAAGDHTLYLDKATVGSGVSEAANMRIAVDLVNMQADASIVSRESVDGAVKIKVQIGPSDTEAYTAREVGLWAHIDDDESILFSLHQDSNGGMSIPLLSESPDFAFGMFIVIAVSNTESMQVNVDTSAIVSSDTLNRTIDDLTANDVGAAGKTHASQHLSGGADPITPAGIGAAPAGFGLGEVMEFSSVADIDNLYLSGNYRFFVDGGFSVAGVNMWSFYMRVDGYDENNFTQTIYCGGTSPVIIKRSKCGTLGEWECENPPMVLGVEYRTTERCNGKTVYAVRLNLGTFGSGMHTVDTGIRATSVVRTSNMPVIFNDPTFNKNYMINVDPSVNGTLICRIVIGELNTAVGITITLWYTKD